jgi:hypothetical protein
MVGIIDLLPFSNFLVVQLKQKFVPHIQIKYNLINWAGFIFEGALFYGLKRI